MTKKLRPLPWYGSKNGYGKAEWIAGLLPWEKDTHYIEPYAGMAGVLLARNRVNQETLNDLDGLVVNWWKVLREQPDAFGWAVQCIPHSRAEFQRALQIRDDPNADPFDRAVAFHTIAAQAVMQRLRNPTWRFRIKHKPFPRVWRPDDIGDLAERLVRVQLECCPAEELLERVADEPRTVIYCDPPYVQTSSTSLYRVVEVDIDRLTDLLLAQRGRVAISGVHDEWDHLGWQRHEREGIRHEVPGELAKGAKELIEVLWTSYDAIETLPLLKGECHQ